MATVNVQNGDSIRIAIILPADRMDRLVDATASIAGVRWSIAGETLIVSDTPNMYWLDITSNQSSAWIGLLEVSLAVEYEDLGLKKTPKTDNLFLNVLKSPNTLSNAATSELSTAIITVAVDDSAVSTDITLSAYFKGDQGEQGEQGVQGLKGDKGDTGNQGATGVVDYTTALINAIIF
jgi:hypothetical protein